MPGPLPTLDDILALSKATLVGNTTTNLALVDGDPLLALLQAAAVGDLVVLSAIESAISFMRAHTSVAGDLDDWMTDFAFPRILATKASGFAEFQVNPVLGAIIPVGLSVASSVSATPGAAYETTADPTNPFYSATPFPRYVVAPNSASFLNISVQALNAGSSSNVSAGALNSLIVIPTGVSGVFNRLPIMNGADAESDTSYLLRFRSFILGLNGGNEDAISLAVAGVIPNGSFALFDNLATASTGGLPVVTQVIRFQANFFLIVAEDGSGTLTPAEQADIREAVARVVHFGTGFDVRAPTVVPVRIAATILYDFDFAASLGDAQAAIAAAIERYVNELKIGEPLFYSELLHRVLQQSVEFPGIVAVEFAEVNGTFAIDYYPASTSVLRIAPTPTAVILTMVPKRV